MNKKLCSILMLLLAAFSYVFAERQTDTQHPDNMNSWQKEFSVKNKDGKYNIIVEAEDQAGNVTVAGPYNIYIDNESDLPVTGITNPGEQQRVPGNLNIVGTCIDDDKVAEVWLVLDGDKEHPVKANGTEYWSYYLETADLLEGPHTIEAYGIDDGNPNIYKNPETGEIDLSQVKPKTGHSVFVTWQLDRRAPVIEINANNHYMGELVRGKINLEGTVRDGNGIKRLEFSTDGGKYYKELNIKEVKLKTPDENGNTSYCTFSVPIDTKKNYEDGAATVWFKAVDNAGSIARYAFLFFVDNTNPEIVIVSPQPNEVQNGIITVAGYAYDANNIAELTWEYAGEKGEYDLTSGNPYFVLNLDTRKSDKNEQLIITATDTMSNVAVKKQLILADQNLDKPVVTINSPAEQMNIDNEAGIVIFRGSAKDDDGIVEVRYSVDGGEEKIIETSGVFYAEISGIVTEGAHSISVYGVDKFGLKGNPSTVTFYSRGTPPVFETPVIKTGNKEVPFKNGDVVNPEAEPVFEIKVVSGAGFSGGKYTITSDAAETIEGDLPDPFTGVASIPLYGDKYPWGVATITVSVADTFNRISEYKAVVNIKDLTQPQSSNPGVYFTDSSIGNDGGFRIAEGKKLSGYFVGGTIDTVTVVPAIRGVTVSKNGNSIIVNGTDSTPEFQIRVKTTANGVYESRKLHFTKDGVLPTLTVPLSEDAEKSIPLEFRTNNERKTITGNVGDAATRVSYRIFSVKANYDEKGLITSSEVLEPTEFKDVQVVSNNRRNTHQFTINFTADEFVDGIHVIEIQASNDVGLVSKVVYVKKITPIPEPQIVQVEKKDEATGEPVVDEEGNPVTETVEIPVGLPAVPAIYWLEGNNFYGVVIYQGKLGGPNEVGDPSDDREFVLVNRNEIIADQEGRTINAVPSDREPEKIITEIKDKKGKVIQTTERRVWYTATLIPPEAECLVEAEFTTVNGAEPYYSGATVVLPRNATEEEGNYVNLTIRTQTEIKSVKYKISGEDAPGGDKIRTGSAAIESVGEGEYTAKIPLVNLPARPTDIEVSVSDAAGEKTFKGTIIIVREYAAVDSSAKVYWKELENVVKDNNRYILNNGAPLIGYANVPGPVTAALVRANPKILVETEGNIIKLNATSDGTYENVSVKVTGSDGSTYTSSAVTFVVDNGAPTIYLPQLVNMSYVGNSIPLSGTVTDGNGVKTLEYVLRDKTNNEDQLTWSPITFNSRNGTISTSIDISEVADGYVPVDIRAENVNGKESIIHYAFFKDVTPPEVKVLLPVAEMNVTSKKGKVNVINGENDIVFSVKDQSRVSTIRYTSSDSRISNEWRVYAKGNEVPVKTVEDENGNVVPVELKKDQLRTMNSPLPNMRIGTADYPHDNSMEYTFTDEAGNITTIKEWGFKVDEESDKPVVEIHLPVEKQVIVTDFTISGIINDDDGPCQFYYKLDDEEWQVFDNGNATSNFRVDRKISTVTDNEHTIYAYAVDQNGVRGEITERKICVSTEDPRGDITAPDMTKTVSGPITLKGVSSDNNGIQSVQISLDNGATYNDANGTEEWTYSFDTRVIKDGTHAIFLKITDKYGITGLFSTLINIDNTAPVLDLELPLDDSKTSKEIFFSGQTTDNIGLTELYITIRSLENKVVPASFARRNLEPAEIISEHVDISGLEDGFYNIELTGTDAAGNISRVSRNIQIDKARPLTTVELLYPLNGEHMQGEFNIYGQVDADETDPVEKMQLYLDGEVLEVAGEAVISATGYYKFHMTPHVKISSEVNFELTEGLHKYMAVATTKSGKVVSSNEQVFIYNPYGPWVSLDNFAYGDFAVNRPLLSGKAGYVLSDAEKELLKSKDTQSEVRKAIELKKVKRIYLSFDNGKTYEPVSKENKGTWSYRIENLDIPSGLHFLLIKAEMQNGENAVTRTLVQIDRTNPTIKLISPGAGGHYNQMLEFKGLSSDDVQLKDVRLTLRKGDKAGYEVPGFIQGLYLDANFWGASLYSVGIGLTAFDNAVKIQGQFGQFTTEQRYAVCKLLGQDETDYRFGGNIIGAKIIAQVGYIPFRYFFGRDFDWLSASISLGANFSWFSDSGASTTSGERVSQVLSAALVQIEFPRITFSNQKMFKTWAVYAEPQCWFIPSDVAGDDAKRFVFTGSLGLRTSVF